VWAFSGLTDIHHQGYRPGKDVQNGDHGTEEARPRRSFTPEFKAEIVELCRQGDRSIGQVAKDFDLSETAVQAWVHQEETDAGERPRLTTEERAELIRLRREVRKAILTQIITLGRPPLVLGRYRTVKVNRGSRDHGLLVSRPPAESVK
jgi:transposase